MALLGKKKQTKLQKMQEIRLEVPVPDFTPYACHYDTNTILTKNGELLQTIKITGFSYERMGGEVLDLRDTVRQAIQESIDSTQYALWFHTIRRKTDLSTDGEFPEIFSKYVDDSWDYLNDWQNQYVNELYITIIREGATLNILDPKDYVRTLLYPAYKNYHDDYLEKAWIELNETAERMLLKLRNYGAKRLATAETKDTVYSEPLQFFGKIMHLKEEQLLIPLMDASEYLATHRIAFGNNTLEIKGEKDKRFGAVLTIKEYHEMSPKVIDGLLQLPQEFIITQCMVFTSAKKALATVEYQDYVLGVSGDEEFKEHVGLRDMVASNQGRETDYCEQQTSICVFSDALENLDVVVKNAMKALQKMGVVAIREDVRMEEIFWSQLPGNFSFIRRTSYLNTARIGGYASLNNYPAGQATGNLWGAAITVFRTSMGTPYFFNFHTEEVGHTLLIGPPRSGKTVLMNFLVCQALKFRPHIFFFDQGHAARILIEALQGHYTELQPAAATSRFNPLLLEDTPFNREFLEKWFGYLAGQSGEPLKEFIEGKSRHIVAKLFSLPREQRRLSTLLAQCGEDVGAEYKEWIGDGKYAYLFDNETDGFSLASVHGFAMDQIAQDNVLIGPVVSYLLQRIQLSLDGTPTIVVLDNAWALVDNDVFAPELEVLLDRLRSRNALIVFSDDVPGKGSESLAVQTVNRKVATKLYLPNFASAEVYRAVLGLNDEEMALFTAVDAQKRQFLLKHGKVAVIGEVDLYGLDDIIALLSGGDKLVGKVEEIINEVGRDPNVWVPVFCERTRKS